MSVYTRRIATMKMSNVLQRKLHFAILMQKATISTMEIFLQKRIFPIKQTGNSLQRLKEKQKLL